MANILLDKPNIERLRELAPNDGVLQFIEFMEISFQKLSQVLGPKNNGALDVIKENIRITRALLNTGMGDIVEPACSTVYMAVLHLMIQSFILGQDFDFLDPASSKAHQATRARKANPFHIKAAKERNEPLDAAIISEIKVTKRKRAKSIGYAGALRKGILKRLELDPESKDPTDEKIRRRLYKIWPTL